MGPCCLLIIDVQRYFINQWTQHVPVAVESLQHEYDSIVASRFVNLPASPYRKFMDWNRCGPGTNDTDLAFSPRADASIIEKSRYSMVTPDLLASLLHDNITSVDICGIATDNCVLKSAMDLFEASICPRVLVDACGSHGGPVCHAAGIRVLQRTIGINNVIL